VPTVEGAANVNKSEINDGKGRVAWQEQEQGREAWGQEDRLRLSVHSRKVHGGASELLGTCPVAMKDLELDRVYQQWLPLTPPKGGIYGAHIRVRLRRRQVPRGDMSEPIWIPLIPSPTSSDLHGVLYVRLAIGFVSRQPDSLNLRKTHQNEKIGAHDTGAHDGAHALLQCDAILQAGAVTKKIKVSSAAGQDVSMPIDDHTLAVRIGILDNTTVVPPVTSTRFLGELLIVPCLMQGLP